MKKLLTGLGTTFITALPVLAVVSCGSTTTTKKDLEIVNITTGVNQGVIDKAITDYNTANAIAEQTDVTAKSKLDALQTIFTGVTKENMSNFTVEAKATVTTVMGVITLTANTDYLFVKETTITSIANLEITSKLASQANIDKAITDYLVAEATSAQQVTALSLIFDGITESNLKLIKVTPVATVEDVKGKITLEVVSKTNGFVIAPTLVNTSVTTLKITQLKDATSAIVKQAITDLGSMTEDTTPENKLKFLQTIFVGVTLENMGMFTIEQTPLTKAADAGTVMLTTVDGYTFEAGLTVTSVTATATA